MSRPRVDLCVLLAGGLKPSPLAASAGCSVLDLSADGSQTIMQHWIEHLAPLGSESSPLPVRIMHGSHLAPTTPPDSSVPPGLRLRVERETKEFRGPAGVVKDAAIDLPPDATVLVIEAARWFGGGLAPVLDAHHRTHPDAPHAAVTVTATSTSAPGGIVVLERSTLDLVSELGFMDLKEQWLGKVREAGRTVRVVEFDPDSPSVLLRNRPDLLEASRACLRRRRATGVQNPSPGTPRPLYSEAEQGYFAAVSPESTVEPNTSIVDSVIMKGAVVRAGAIVARSLVCPGATVEANEVVVDQVRAGSRNGVPSGVGRGERSG